jgi:hypothetical protein
LTPVPPALVVQTVELGPSGPLLTNPTTLAVRNPSRVQARRLTEQSDLACES